MKWLPFSSFDATKDPQIFLDEMEKLCITLGCFSVQLVKLASFKINDVAY